MASKRAVIPAKHLFTGFRAYQQPTRHFSPCLSRSMATVSEPASTTLEKAYKEAHLDSAPTQPILEDNVPTPPSGISISAKSAFAPPPNPFLRTTTCTLYNFPTLEPVSFANYPSTHLLLPLRRDILHKAVIYEGDNTRSGTAHTKYRSEIHGSGRKMRPQKGSGKARMGDKKAPHLRGGGVAHGPRHRDFGTDLPSKIYDLAWRTALSYRYAKGELVVTDSEIDVPGVHENSLERYVKEVLLWNRMGKPDGRTMFITDERRDSLFFALEMEGMGAHGEALEKDLVDVKDLLSMGRIVVERTALESLFRWHESDLAPRQRLGAWDSIVAAGQTAAA